MRTYRTPTRSPRRLLDRLTQRTGDLRGRFNQVLPVHWTQLIAGITTAGLVVMILTRGLLALYYDPSMGSVTYAGPFDNLRGVDMTRAYASVLHITFEVRGGLFVLQVNAWASSLFVGSLLVQLAVLFFTGGFRQPHRPVWTVTVVLLIAGILTAFSGVLLGADLLSDTSLRMISAYLLSAPVVGTWLHWLVFGGEFPGTEVIPRVYVVHWVLLASLAGLLVLRAALLRRTGPPRFPGHRRTERGVVDVVGVRSVPGFAARLATVAVATAGVLALMGGLFQINPAWHYGPGNPAQVSAGSASPWYFGWVDGAVRLFPAWELQLGGYLIPPQFWPALVFLPVSFLALLLYPRFEQRFSRDHGPHDLPQRPRDVPWRTALGVAVLAGYGCLQLAAAIDVLAFHFDLSADALLSTARVVLLVLPPLAYLATYRLCLGLRRHDRETLRHGIPTGIITRSPHGGFEAAHQPLAPDAREYRGIPVPKKPNKIGPASSGSR